MLSLIGKIKKALVLKGIFSETKLTYSLVCKFSFNKDSSIILMSFRQGGGFWGRPPPPPPPPRTPPQNKPLKNSPRLGLKNAFFSLKINKSSGADDVSFNIIKKLFGVLCKPLTLISTYFSYILKRV